MVSSVLSLQSFVDFLYMSPNKSLHLSICLLLITPTRSFTYALLCSVHFCWISSQVSHSTWKQGFQRNASRSGNLDSLTCTAQHANKFRDKDKCAFLWKEMLLWRRKESSQRLCLLCYHVAAVHITFWSEGCFDHVWWTVVMCLVLKIYPSLV